MKKYIIKNADGSEQSEMQAIHESRKEAGETLMDYICDHNEDLDVDDDDYLSPFDFALEEVECTKSSRTLRAQEKPLASSRTQTLPLQRRFFLETLLSLKMLEDL